MRYIEKTTAPGFLTEWVKQTRETGLTVRYNDFPEKRKLNDVLRTEQHCVCCYCQRQIDHFNNPPLRGSLNEHLYPENVKDDPKSLALQMEYTNIFACCKDSAGHKKREKHLRHCDVAKENQLIREFIKEEYCESFFRYNILGEVIPNGELNTWEDYMKSTNLSDDILDARNAIATLNLNSPVLVADRKECVTELVRYIPKKTKEEIESLVSAWMEAEQYPSYISLRLQMIRGYLKKIA